VTNIATRAMCAASAGVSHNPWQGATKEPGEQGGKICHQVKKD